MDKRPIGSRREEVCQKIQRRKRKLVKFPSLDVHKMRVPHSKRERVILVRLRFKKSGQNLGYEELLPESGTPRSLALPSIPYLRDFRARLCIRGMFVCPHVKTELLSNERLDRLASRSCGRSRITRKFCPRPMRKRKTRPKRRPLQKCMNQGTIRHFQLLWFL